MATNYKILALNALDDNYIWLIHDQQNAVVIDPTLAEPVIDYLLKHNLTLQGILLTHSHADHTGGVNALSQQYNPQIIDNFNFGLSEEQKLQIGDFPFFTVILTPGHMHEHVCYLLDRQHLFCGDTLFANGCGRVFTNDFVAMHSSLAKLKTLADNIECYPAHEYTLKNLNFTESIGFNMPAYPEYSQFLRAKLSCYKNTLPTTLADELKYNLFLQCDNQLLWARTSELTASKIGSDLECFIAIRQLRNDF